MPTPVDPFVTEADLQAQDAEAVLVIIRSEAEALADTLDLARNVQWTAANPEPGVNGQPANPTADITANPERLALRLQVISSERALRETALRLATLRASLDRALEPYGGDLST
jgi:hypothetical protein